MKKTTFINRFLLLLLLVSSLFTVDVNAQSDFYNVISGTATSPNGRAPQSGRAITRSVYLLTAAEVTASGMLTNDVINGIGFTYSVAGDIATTGNIVIYLQNTSDVAYTKATTWDAAIAGMTTVSNGAITIPNTIGDFNYNFTGASPFTYTGGGIYVAFDYQNLSNPVSTGLNTALCNTSLASGIYTGMSAVGSTTPPTTIAVSSFRPQTRLGKAVICARPQMLNANLAAATTTTATVSWFPAGGSNVDIIYGAYGFNPVSAGTTVTNVTSPYVVAGLTANTVYQFYVRTNCGATMSALAGPFSFNTVFTAANTPYNTGFEQDALHLIGWSIPNATPVAGDWTIGVYGAGPLVQEGVASVLSITPSTSAANNWLFSRGINLTAGSNVTVSYYISNYQANTTATANYEVKVGNAASSAAMTTLVAEQIGLTGSAFALKTHNFTAATTGVHHFGFLNKTPANASGTHAIIIDNFTVTQVLNNDEFLASNFSVYPNPAKNTINVTSGLNATISSIEMTDMNGRVVKTQNMNSTEGQISISDLSTGVYMMKVASDKGVITKKVIKE